MFSEKDSISYFNTLISADFESLLQTHPKRQSIKKILEENHSRFHEKMRLLGGHRTRPALENSLDQKILEIEKRISVLYAWEDFESLAGLEKNTAIVKKFFPSSEERGFFLSEEAADQLLSTNPPKQLLSIAADVGIEHNPLAQIALSRHTEPEEWQRIYRESLCNLTKANFEERNVTCLSFDSNALKELLASSGQREKPWRISHNKEAGIVNSFTHPSSSKVPAPHVQHILVLLHYYFETYLAGCHARIHALQGSKYLGHLVGAVISTHENRFPFFHPNAYSEHLFWEKALSTFSNHFNEWDDVSFFSDTIDCGEYPNKGLSSLSLNLVDRVWDVNLLQETNLETYFGWRPNRFTYHFKEGLWYKILCTLSGLSPEAAHLLIVNNLHHGDQDLTEIFLKNHAKSHINHR